MRGSGRPVWDDEASAEDLATLDPGPPDELPRTPDVLVVGGGIAGLATAAMCTRAGMDVLLIERERLAQGASGRAAGGLAPDAHPQAGPDWHAFARHSLDLHRELDAEWSYGLETLDLRVVPDLNIPDQARVDPLRLAAAFARRAGVVATRVEALSWDDNFTMVRTTAGDITAGAVVFATGTADACDATQSLVKGHLIAIEPASFRLGEIVATIDSDFLALQLPSGRIVAGGTKEPADDTDDVIDATCERVKSKLAEVVPSTRDLAMTHGWCCFRPKMSGELPLLDRIGERAFIVAGLYSTGILMAPAVGEATAGWVQGERPGGAEAFALPARPS